MAPIWRMSPVWDDRKTRRLGSRRYEFWLNRSFSYFSRAGFWLKFGLVKDEGLSVKTNSLLVPIARKLFWWTTSEDALKNPIRFVAQVMALGTWEDVQTTRFCLGDSLFLETLKTPPTGVFDPASWIYWHNFFGLHPIPELPKRAL